MSRIFRLSLVVCVLTVWGCGKKKETAVAPAVSSDSATASVATEAVPSAQPSVGRTAAAIPGPSLPGELPIIAKARAFLANEAALNAVTSIRYQGTLVTTDPKDSSKQTRAAIDIFLQKPDRQRMTITSDKSVEYTGLDGYEAWTRIQVANDRTKWQQKLLSPDGVKQMRANTWENLAFFRGIEKEGGRAEDLGPVTIDGVACEKVAFVHAPKIVFYRYFERATGRVVLTETETGGVLREQGEIVVAGVRFPKTLVTISKNPAGQSQTVTMTFDKITVNETAPAGFFSVPALKNR